MNRKITLSIICSIIASIGAALFIFMQSPKTKKLAAPVIIFDFDGTIANSTETTVSIVNQVLKEYDFNTQISREELRSTHLTGLLKKHAIPYYKLPFFQKRVLELMKDRMDRIPLVDGMSELFIALKKSGFNLAILTSNTEENVLNFLHTNDIKSFDVVYSGASLFGKQKVLKNFLTTYNLAPSSVLYVGDETRDIEATKAVNIAMIAVSWGFNKKELLHELHPYALVDNPTELFRFIKFFFNQPVP